MYKITASAVIRLPLSFCRNEKRFIFTEFYEKSLPDSPVRPSRRNSSPSLLSCPDVAALSND
jgi:hypothetical protein